MVSGTPYYIILGELGIAAGITWCARYVIHGKRISMLWAGIAAGLWIFLCYAVSFFLTMRSMGQGDEEVQNR